MKIVSIYSGGLDSTTMIHYLKNIGHSQIAVSFYYGQQHNKEIKYARSNCEKLGLPMEVVRVNMATFNLPLMGDGEIPDGYYTDESMKQTIVPSRNAMFLSIAWGIAVNTRSDGVAIAAHSGDHPIYPDCRTEFMNQMEYSLNLGVDRKIELVAPFLAKDKTEIVVLGNSNEVDYRDTWSCYKGGKLHCGKCGTCTERKEAFDLAGVKDPTIYELEVK